MSSSLSEPTLFVITTPLTQHLITKWILTPKNHVGRILTASEEEDAIVVMFPRRSSRADMWLCRCDDLLGSRFFNTEAEAVAARDKNRNTTV